MGGDEQEGCLEANTPVVVVQAVEGEPELVGSDHGPEEVLGDDDVRGVLLVPGVAEVRGDGGPDPDLPERQVGVLIAPDRLAYDEELLLVEAGLRGLLFDLPLRYLDDGAAVPEREEVTGIDHPHELVAPHGSQVVPGEDRGLPLVGVRGRVPLAVQVEPGAEARQVQPLHLDRFGGHGKALLGRLADEDAPVAGIQRGLEVELRVLGAGELRLGVEVHVSGPHRSHDPLPVLALVDLPNVIAPMTHTQAAVPQLDPRGIAGRLRRFGGVGEAADAARRQEQPEGRLDGGLVDLRCAGPARS